MRLGVLLVDGFADWEAALLMAAARGHMGFDVTTASPDGNAVVSMGGLRVAPDLPMARLEPGPIDALVMPGGAFWESADGAALATPAPAFRDAGRPVAAACAATLALARTGLLETVAHTSNGREYLAATGYGGGAGYRDVRQAVSDGGIVTAAGTAPVTFAVAVLAALGRTGPDVEGFAALFAAEHGAG
jgi:putative intracellular protease/amidase